jgi:hypothetical protein
LPSCGVGSNNLQWICLTDTNIAVFQFVPRRWLAVASPWQVYVVGARQGLLHAPKAKAIKKINRL